MKITKELILKVHDYINKNTGLNKNLEYLLQYHFTGIDNLNGTNILTVIAGKNGLVNFCSDEVFSHGINLDVTSELEQTVVPVLANYLISYLTSFAAIDLFLAKYRDHYFKTINSPLIKIISTKYAHTGLDGCIIVELMEDEPNGGMAAFDMNIVLEGTNEYKPMEKPLDLTIMIQVMQNGDSWSRTNKLSVKDLSTLALEDFFEQAGW